MEVLFVVQLASCVGTDGKDCRADSSSVKPEDEGRVRSPQNEKQDCEDSSGSKQEEEAAVNSDDHFTPSKPSLFTIEYLMKMPSSAVPSRSGKSALKL
jgi:hypothetical protein